VSNAATVIVSSANGDMGKSLLGDDVSFGGDDVMTVTNPLYDGYDVPAGPGDQACRGK